jgi:hypothetical protein
MDVDDDEDTKRSPKKTNKRKRGAGGSSKKTAAQTKREKAAKAKAEREAKAAMDVDSDNDGSDSSESEEEDGLNHGNVSVTLDEAKAGCDNFVLASRTTLSTVSNLISPLRALIHASADFAHKLWVLLFPVAWSKLTLFDRQSLIPALNQLLAQEWQTNPNIIQVRASVCMRVCMPCVYMLCVLNAHIPHSSIHIYKHVRCRPFWSL